MPGSSEPDVYPEQLNFINLAWGGTAGKTCYPACVNWHSLRAIEKADGRPITQAHDREQLRMNVKHWRRVHNRPKTPPAKSRLCTNFKCSSACLRSRAMV